jgi:hypothetical protein
MTLPFQKYLALPPRLKVPAISCRDRRRAAATQQFT